MNYNIIIGISCLLLISVCWANDQNVPSVPDYDYDEVNDNGENVDQENDEGATSSTGEIPVFKHKSMNITIKEGETVTMNCQVKKSTEHLLIFQQKKESQKIFYVGDMKVLKSTKLSNKDQVFEIPNVSRSDGGTYICIYQTKPEVMLTFNVNVQYQPTVFSKTPKKQTVKKGSSVTVKCHAKGNPTPVIKWSKKNGRLPSGAESEVGTSILMEDVDRHIEGTYICTADNGVGKPASAVMKVMVEYIPEITTEKAIVRTEEGDIVELVCIIHARPAAKVTWSRDGTPLRTNPSIKEVDGGHRHTLAIEGVTEDKFGTYKCSAHNLMGVTNAEITLTDEPKQPHFTSAATSALETKYTLAWDTESFYPITEYLVKYRLSKANDTTDLPGEWHMETVTVAAEKKPKNDLVHHMKHEIEELLPATSYEAVVSVKSKLKQGKEGTFHFSTRKEMVGQHTKEMNGANYQRASVVLLIISLILCIL